MTSDGNTATEPRLQVHSHPLGRTLGNELIAIGNALTLAVAIATYLLQGFYASALQGMWSLFYYIGFGVFCLLAVLLWAVASVKTLQLCLGWTSWTPKGAVATVLAALPLGGIIFCPTLYLLYLAIEALLKVLFPT